MNNLNDMERPLSNDTNSVNNNNSTSNSNSNAHSVIQQTHSSNAFDFAKTRRKNPKDMSIQELEEYIQRNRNRNNNNQLRFNNHNMNNSFQAYNHHFALFDTQSNVNSMCANPNNSKDKDDDICSSASKHHQHQRSFQLQSQYNDNNTTANEAISFANTNANTNTNNNISTTTTTLIKDFINNSPYTSYRNITTINPTNTNSNSNTPTTNVTSPNPIESLNSKAATNYIKSLRDKIKELSLENDELKDKLNSRSICGGNANNNMNNPLLPQSATNTINNDDSLQMQINILNKNLQLVEKERQRHIEQNAIEKAKFVEEINMLKNELEVVNGKYNDKVDEYEKMKMQFESERSEMIETMKSLREIIFQKENEKNAIIMQYESLLVQQQGNVATHQQQQNVLSTNSHNQQQQYLLQQQQQQIPVKIPRKTTAKAKSKDKNITKLNTTNTPSKSNFNTKRTNNNNTTLMSSYGHNKNSSNTNNNNIRCNKARSKGKKAIRLKSSKQSNHNQLSSNNNSNIPSFPQPHHIISQEELTNTAPYYYNTNNNNTNNTSNFIVEELNSIRSDYNEKPALSNQLVNLPSSSTSSYFYPNISPY